MCLAIGLASAGVFRPTPALAFACYVGESPQGFVTVHKKPDSGAKIVARLTQFMMVSEGRRMRERDGWIFVHWSTKQMSQDDFFSGKGEGKGWMRRQDIRGECED